MERENAVEWDVLVVGAGPTGLVMASEAVRHGLRCRIVDKAPAPSETSKALGVQARTVEVFEAMGLAEEALGRGQPLEGLQLSIDGNPAGTLRIAGLDSPFPFLLVLEQSETERMLIGHLERLGTVVERSVTLERFDQDENGVRAILLHPDGRREAVRSRWLIGCDGAHSTVRHGLRLSFKGAPYEEEFILADVRIDWKLPPHEAYGFLSEGHLLGIIPLRGAKRYRLIATRSPLETSGAEEPSLEEFQALVDARVPIEAKVSDPAWLAAFRVHRRIVSRLRTGRVFLAGDAAHIHSPAGGQGMNTGIQDAFNLAWKLALTTTGEARPALIESYHAERYPVARQVLRSTDLLFRLVLAHSPLLKRARTLFVRLLLPRELLQHRFRKFISELQVNYRHSPAVSEHRPLLPLLRPQPGESSQACCRLGGLRNWFHFMAGPHAGDRAPDGTAIDFATRAVLRLFHLFRETNHTLLLFTGVSNPEAVHAFVPELLQTALPPPFGRHIRFYLLAATEASARSLAPYGPVLLDPGQAIHGKYGAAAPCLYLVRPDGYIGFRSLPLDARPLLSHLSGLFR